MGILVFTDKVIKESLAKEMIGWLKTTKVGKLFDEEKIEAVREATREAAREMLKNEIQIEKVILCIKQLTKEVIYELQKELER